MAKLPTEKRLDTLYKKLTLICGKYVYFGEYAAEEGWDVSADYIVECLHLNRDEVRQLLLNDGWEIVKENDFDGEEFSGRCFCIVDARPTKTYEVIYKETSVGIYFIDADSEEEALAKFEKASAEGEIDFSDMAIDDIETTVKEMKS